MKNNKTKKGKIQKEKGTKQHNKDGVRKYGRYGTLCKLATLILKQLNIQDQCKTTAKNSQIKDQKNYPILIFRLTMAFSRMVFSYKYEQQQAIKNIFEFLSVNMDWLAQRKYIKNNQDFRIAVKQKGRRDIKALSNIFLSDLCDRAKLQNIILTELFIPNKNNIYLRKQKQSAQKLAKIIFQFWNYYSGEQQTNIPSVHQFFSTKPELTNTMMIEQNDVEDKECHRDENNQLINVQAQVQQDKNIGDQRNSVPSFQQFLKGILQPVYPEDYMPLKNFQI